ncbi:MAG: hypothetical protein JWO53_784 [Chlamydiia bacterium]|nr:hypothetical protein [Chlamydiia bacterium]
MANFQTIDCYIIHNCYTLNTFNKVTAWRNSGSLGVRSVKCLTAEAAYAGLVVLGVIECLFKSIACVIAIQLTCTTGYEFSNDAALSFQTSLCSIAHLISNLFLHQLEQIPLGMHVVDVSPNM